MLMEGGRGCRMWTGEGVLTDVMHGITQLSRESLFAAWLVELAEVKRDEGRPVHCIMQMC